MSLVESTAAFNQRGDEIVEDGSLRASLDGQGIRSHSAMAFSMGKPQMTPTEDQFVGLAQRIHRAGYSVGQMSALMRLHVESTTLVISMVRERVTSENADKADAARKIPLAEKRQRREDQMARLTGISMVGELDPSHDLLDLANQILESGAIVWLAPSKCSQHDDEVQQALKDSESSIQVENAQLKVGPSPDAVEADWNSELKFQWCMMRQVSSGFQQIKVDQLVRANREMWTILAQEVTDSLKATGNDIPLDAHVNRLKTDPRVTMVLLPLPSNQKVHGPSGAPTKPSTTRPAASPKRPAKRKTRAERGCPEELEKYNIKVLAEQVCWNYNLKDGCQLPTHGKPARCQRGLHMCANCHKPGHSVVVCRDVKGS